MMSAAEALFAFQLRAVGIEHDREVLIVPGRRWRADFVIRPDLMIEIEGGAWTNGRHTRGRGFVADCEKYAAAMLAGYRVLRVTPDMVRDGRALEYALRLARGALEVNCGNGSESVHTARHRAGNTRDEGG